MLERGRIRTTIVFLFFFSLYSFIIGNLMVTQLYQRSFFNTLGMRQYMISTSSGASRGEIYDRNGEILAHNKESIAAFVFPKHLKDRDRVLVFLQKYFPKAYERFMNQSLSQNFFYVKRRLSEAEIALIKNEGIPDIQLLNEPHRYYTHPSTGTVIGITDIDNRGLFGIEKIFEHQLAGIPSSCLLERDARTGFFYFSKQLQEIGEKGKPIALTIDSLLQFFAYEELKKTVEKFDAQSGAVLIIDPTNGEILAMVNFPDFDPNNTEYLDLETTRNRIVTDCYEFGSVVKAFVALAAIEEGVVDAEEIIDCEDTTSTVIEGIQVNTVLKHGKISFADVIAGSNNIGIAKVALRLGPKLYEHYHRLGFGKYSGLNFPGEQKGVISHPSHWSNRSLFSLSYGYEISANLLQLGRAFCIIARDGLDVHLSLLKDDKKIKKDERLYSLKAVEVVKKILKKTVEEGTASHAYVEGFEVRGKTGSADMLINGKYDKTRSLFTFAGIIEKGDYQRVVICFIKDVARRRLYASSVTVPLFREIVEKMLIHEKEFN